MAKRNRISITERQIESFHYEPTTPTALLPGMKRTAAYCRVSTLYEEQELSFDSQCEFYRNYIKKAPDMTLVGIYGDQGFSGLQSKQRKEFQRLMADCEAGKIDLILVKSVSRFSRNTVECMECLQRLKALGVGVYFEKEGMSSLDPQTEMILAIYASIAQNESCALSANVRWAKRRKAEMGDPDNMACYGYRMIKCPDGEVKHKWIVHEEEAKRIRLIFQMAYQGYAAREILYAVNQYEEEHGKPANWTIARVYCALDRETYKGDLLTNKIVVLDCVKKKCVKNDGFVDQFYLEQHHDPIVEPDVFDSVQQYRKQGLLNGRNSAMRNRWFQEHPEILARRQNQIGGEEEK